MPGGGVSPSPAAVKSRGRAVPCGAGLCPAGPWRVPVPGAHPAVSEDTADRTDGGMLSTVG